MSERSMSSTNANEARASTPDIVVHGNPDDWECVNKASSHEQGWLKSTKRMRVNGGWLYQVTTEHRHDGKVVACAEALAFVPYTAEQLQRPFGRAIQDALTKETR